MNEAAVSLMMVNYNRAPYIAAALNSVLAQTNKNWELIIIDDGSNDGSLEIIKKYLSDPRIKLTVNHRRLGIVGTRIQAIQASQYEIIGIIDSDDVLRDDAVNVMLQKHSANENGLIYSQMMICDKNLKPLMVGGNRALTKNSSNLIENVISHFITFKKSTYFKTPGYDLFFNRCAEDKDLFYKLEEVSDPLFIDEILYYYRLNPSSVSNYGLKKIWGRLLYLSAKYQAYRRRRQNHSSKQVKLWQILPWVNKILIKK